MATLLDNPHIRHIYDESLIGLHAFARAATLSVRNAEVRATYKRFLVPLAALSVFVYVAVHAMMLPMRIMLYFMGKSADVGHYGGKASALVPVISIWAVRCVYRRPLEAAFFATLKEVDPKEAKEVEALPARGMKEYMIAAVKRTATLLMYGPVWWFLSMVPGVSFLLKFMFQVYSLAKWMEPELAVCAAVLAVFPLTEYVATLLTQLFLSEMFYWRELMQPYLTRRQMRTRDEYKFVTRRRVAVLAFLLPLELLGLLPIVGPFTCILAHGIAGVGLKAFLLDGGGVGPVQSPTPTAIPTAEAVIIGDSASSAIHTATVDGKKVK